MKNIFLSSIAVVLTLFSVISCQSPEDLTPSISRNGINSLTASFPNDDSDENSFKSEIDFENHIINVVIPYNYPLTSDHVVVKEELTKMRITANLDDNVTLYPKLLFLDLSKENVITIVDQTKKEIEFKVVSEIRKSNKCAITKFDIPSAQLTGIIDDATKTISLISIEDIGTVLADISISHGATIAPDPRVEALNFDGDVKLTVTAQNGVDKAIYTIKKNIPEKVELGLRANSGKLLFAKKLIDLGITSKNMTTGIAPVGDYVVINTRGENSIYIDAKTGENVGNINLGSNKGSLVNFYATADDANNILMCNLTPNSGSTFNIWKIDGVDGMVESFIAYDSGLALGRKLSVIGNIDTDAIITVPICGSAGNFLRWQVSGGNLVSTQPQVVVATGISNFGNNADVIYSNPKDVNSDYFVAYYGAPYKFMWYDGTTNTQKVYGNVISSNWIINAVDYTKFNHTSFALSNSVNSFTWGKDDSIYFYDLTGNTLDSLIDVCETGIYGAKALGEQNPNGTSDVAFRASEDGYYLYVYFMFTNGYVVGVQYDCIKM